MCISMGECVADMYSICTTGKNFVCKRIEKAVRTKYDRECVECAQQGMTMTLQGSDKREYVNTIYFLDSLRGL